MIHVLTVMGILVSIGALFALGALSVWHDLLIRGPWDSPVIQDDEAWKRLNHSTNADTDTDSGSHPKLPLPEHQ
jgi:hypothetical protein